MADISAAKVKELRERTGVGMMDCKKALTETHGDIEAAIDKLRRDSGLKAAKKAGRTAAEGLIVTRLADDGSCGVVVEVNIETDFAARNQRFAAFAGQIADRAFEQRSEDVERVLEGTLAKLRDELVQEIGENISVRRIALLEAPQGAVGSYVHAGDKQGALVALEGGSIDLGRDLAMQVVAMAPLVANPEDIDASQLQREREIYEAQARESGKPAEIIEKMVEGRLSKYAAEVSLVKQPFVKDPEHKVETLLQERGARCLGFVRFEVGEGVEKEASDFAAEVAAQAGSQS